MSSPSLGPPSPDVMIGLLEGLTLEEREAILNVVERDNTLWR